MSTIKTGFELTSHRATENNNRTENMASGFNNSGKHSVNVASNSIILPVVRLLCVVTIIGTLAGCSTMAPKYSQPAAPIPAVWSADFVTTEGVAPNDKPLADTPWRDFFVDQKLKKLIELALKNNRDLKVAALTIERTQALYQIQRGDQLPRIDANAGANFQRIGEDLSSSGTAMTTHQYTIGLGVASYELDFFGRVRSLKEQALEHYLSTEHARSSVQLSLISQVAGAYLTLASDLEHLKLAKETLANQREAYTLVKSRYDAGISTALVLNQAQTTIDSARLEIARYSTAVMQDENALAQLVGSYVPRELLPETLSENLAALNDFTPGLPSQVLLKRPDILQAERQLKAANANIGAAEAAFFPRITLVSSIGLGSDELAGLFKGGSFVWSFAPRISLPLFDAGSNASNLTVSEVDRDIAIARYEKAIQTAFREVADALSQRATIGELVAAQQSLLNSTDQSYRLSQARFDKGVDSYLQVLDAQRSLYAAQQNLIGVRLARLNNLVTLYKVLGGGQ